MLIALDAGHYINTPGRRVWKQFDPDETREWWLNNRIADHVEYILQDYDCQVMRTDDRTGKRLVSIADRCKAANDADADVFFSIHHNGAIHGGAGGGIVIYTRTNPPDTSVRLQRAIYAHTVRITGLRGNRANPMPASNVSGVLTGTTMPSVLGEFGFMDSSTDAPIILTDEFSRGCAQGIVDGLVEVFDIKKGEDDLDMSIMAELNAIPGCEKVTTKDIAKKLSYLVLQAEPSGDTVEEYKKMVELLGTSGVDPDMPMIRWQSILLAGMVMLMGTQNG